MPSAAAASVKVDKQQVTPDSSSLGDPGNQTPLRQVITLVEHKIRNLEKRKSKLESYRDLQNAGKELNADQKTAIAKYNEVMQTLEFARDIYKQFLSIAVLSEKEAKKQAKKEAAAKSQAEMARLREILLVQDALNQMGNESVREDFLHGRNGAAQLTEVDLKLLDDLYPAVTPKHEAGNPTAFTNEVQTAAEHLLAVVDGKPKEVFGGSYTQVKEILGKIHESGYFDQVQAYESYAELEITESAQVDVAQNHESIAAAQIIEPQQQPQQSPQPQISPILLEMRPPPPTVVEQLPPQAVVKQQQQLITPEQQGVVALEQGVGAPDQQIYYQQHPQLAQAAPRPITEMLGAGSFFFLQESEIDPVGGVAEQQQIPTQTYTNQTFAANSPVPPQMIPLATMYVQPQPPTNQQQAQPRQQPVAQLQLQSGAVKTTNNGLEENLKEKGGQSGNRNNARANNSNSGSTHQSYYQNNGYNNNSNSSSSNRPRQNRNNGPRMGSRHTNNN